MKRPQTQNTTETVEHPESNRSSYCLNLFETGLLSKWCAYIFHENVSFSTFDTFTTFYCESNISLFENHCNLLSFILLNGVFFFFFKYWVVHISEEIWSSIKCRYLNFCVFHLSFGFKSTFTHLLLMKQAHRLTHFWDFIGVSKG